MNEKVKNAILLEAIASKREERREKIISIVKKIGIVAFFIFICYLPLIVYRTSGAGGIAFYKKSTERVVVAREAFSHSLVQEKRNGFFKSPEERSRAIKK